MCVRFDEATAARDQARSVYEDLRKQRLETFMSGFGYSLKEMYQMITLGGDRVNLLTLYPFLKALCFQCALVASRGKILPNLSGAKDSSSLALVLHCTTTSRHHCTSWTNPGCP